MERHDDDALTLRERSSLIRQLVWSGDYVMMHREDLPTDALAIVRVPAHGVPLWALSLKLVLDDVMGEGATDVYIGALCSWCADRISPEESARVLASLAVYSADSDPQTHLIEFVGRENFRTHLAAADRASCDVSGVLPVGDAPSLPSMSLPS